MRDLKIWLLVQSENVYFQRIACLLMLFIGLYLATVGIKAIGDLFIAHPITGIMILLIVLIGGNIIIYVIYGFGEELGAFITVWIVVPTVGTILYMIIDALSPILPWLINYFRVPQ